MKNKKGVLVLKILRHPKVLDKINDRYNSMMPHYLMEVKFVQYPNRGLSRNFSARKLATTGIKLSANPAPKSNYTASTLAPQPMPGWHPKVPVRHLDKSQRTLPGQIYLNNNNPFHTFNASNSIITFVDTSTWLFTYIFIIKCQ